LHGTPRQTHRRQSLALGKTTFTAHNPATGELLTPAYTEGTPAEVDQALAFAERDFETFRQQPPERMAECSTASLRNRRAGGSADPPRASETALPEPRLLGERARTVSQIRLFADLLREGSWVEAWIDRRIPDRKPLPKPESSPQTNPDWSGSSFLALATSIGIFRSPVGIPFRRWRPGNPVVVKAQPRASCVF